MATEENPIRILIVDDHSIVREGLRALIERQAHMEVVGEAENGQEAVSLAEELEPDLVVMDINMPGLNGIDATRKIRGMLPESKVIALSMHTGKRYVTEVLRAGASGFLLKYSASKELIPAIESVIKNKPYLSSGLDALVIQAFVEQFSLSQKPERSELTSREREVLQLIAEGHSTKSIAAQMFVSTKTIETHRSKLMKKLDIHSIAALTKYAIREGFTTLD